MRSPSHDPAALAPMCAIKTMPPYMVALQFQGRAAEQFERAASLKPFVIRSRHRSHSVQLRPEVSILMHQTPRM